MARKGGNLHKRHKKPQPQDPTTLLARGYTARWIKGGSKSGKSSASSSGGSVTVNLQPLSAEEMDQDLRHMTAFWTACERYQQHSYVALNNNRLGRGSAGNSNTNDASSTTIATTTPTLPVRLDPDHDKRLQAQRQRLVQAEWKREALEQEYVALRAHYVETCQELKTWTQHREKTTQKWLQQQARQKAQQVAWLRAQVQMTREAIAAWEYRQAAKESTVNKNNDKAPDDSNNTAKSSSSSSSNVLIEFWTSLLEEKSRDNNNNANKTMHATNSSNKPMPWPARQAPATPHGVPVLLSASSTAPEKSLAWAMDTRDAKNLMEKTKDSKGKKERKDKKDDKQQETEDIPWAETPLPKDPQLAEKKNWNQAPLVWMRHQLPQTLGDLIDKDDDDDDDRSGVAPMDTTTTTDAATGGKDKDKHNSESSLASWLLQETQEGDRVRTLRQEVAQLEEQLNAECQRNAASLAETSTYRHRLDEWTTMLSMVRQETEAVLYRHNVLQQSPEIAPRAARQWERQLQQEAAAKEAAAAAAAEEEQSEGKADGGDDNNNNEEEEAANDGDDEGDNATTDVAKRDHEDSPTASRKRRKL